MVREVGVHLEEDVVAARVAKPLLEGGDHGGAAAALLAAVEQLDAARELRARRAHGVAGPVGAAVVGHPHVDPVALGEELADRAGPRSRARCTSARRPGPSPRAHRLRADKPGMVSRIVQAVHHDAQVALVGRPRGRCAVGRQARHVEAQHRRARRQRVRQAQRVLGPGGARRRSVPSGTPFRLAADRRGRRGGTPARSPRVTASVAPGAPRAGRPTRRARPAVGEAAAALLVVEAGDLHVVGAAHVHLGQRRHLDLLRRHHARDREVRTSGTRGRAACARRRAPTRRSRTRTAPRAPGTRRRGPCRSAGVDEVDVAVARPRVRRRGAGAARGRG